MGDFEHLTISAQLAAVERTLDGGAVCIVGSSMGGYLAALYAAKHPEVVSLVLLAPAFNFPSRWRQMAGVEAMNKWRDTGWMEVFHHDDNAMRRIHYGLYEDALRHDPSPAFAQPAKIFHGIQDATVPIEFSRDFAAAHKNAILTELVSDHGLLNVLDTITGDAVPFLVPPHVV